MMVLPMKYINVPAWEWYGWKPERLSFPEGWDVSVQKMKGHDAKVLKPEEIQEKISTPIRNETPERVSWRE